MKKLFLDMLATADAIHNGKISHADLASGIFFCCCPHMLKHYVDYWEGHEKAGDITHKDTRHLLLAKAMLVAVVDDRMVYRPYEKAYWLREHTEQMRIVERVFLKHTGLTLSYPLGLEVYAPLLHKRLQKQGVYWDAIY